jgi:hypothetical protein
VTAGVAVKIVTKEKTLQQKGRRSEENMKHVFKGKIKGTKRGRRRRKWVLNDLR